MSERKKILIIDDEEHIVRMLQINMKTHGYDCAAAFSGEEGVSMVSSYLPDLVLLDVMLPGIDGVEVCRQIKSNPLTRQVPVLMLSAKSQGKDKITGLEGGADDYITKPFSLKELFLRINASLRQVELLSAVHKTQFSIGNLTLDSEKYTVFTGDIRIDLTLTEFRILFLLLKNKGNPVFREVLIRDIFGRDSSGGSRALDVHVRNIRRKLIENKVKDCEIVTIRGIGYRIK